MISSAARRRHLQILSAKACESPSRRSRKPKIAARARVSGGSAARLASPNCRADSQTEPFRAKIRALEYELTTLHQERKLEKEQQQQEIRELQNRAETEINRAQVRRLREQ